MLPSDKSLLEDFKLKHRQMDVMKVRAEVRQMELENVRYASRLLAGENEDPDILALQEYRALNNFKLNYQYFSNPPTEYYSDSIRKNKRK